MRPRFRTRALLILAALLMALGGVIVGFRISQGRSTARYRARLAEASRLMNAGRFSAASRSLAEMAAAWPGRGEVLWQLGRSHEALGRLEQAEDAWRQIAPADPAFPQAAEALGHLLISQGRLAAAETLLLQALVGAPTESKTPLARTLARLLRLEGRFPEVSEALIAAWAGSSDPAALLLELWQNDTEPLPVDAWKLLLDAAPDTDDRVWLGRARLALVMGHFEEAASWLRRCLDRRPDDPVVWRAALDLAVAADDLSRFWDAAARLSAAGFRPAEVAFLRGWLADRGGDLQARNREWGRLLEIDPGNTMALERLIDLARSAGQPGKVAVLQRRKAEIDQARDGIRKLLLHKQDRGLKARELARWSESLGRRFDRHAWSLIAAESEPEGTTPGSPGADADRSFCRTAAETALASLVKREPLPRHSAAESLAGGLSDLKPLDGRSRAARQDVTPPLGDPPRLAFEDDAARVGLNFTFDRGQSPSWLMAETLSGGVGLIDYDGDGWLDVYCVQGGAVVPQSPNAPAGDRLFRNQRDGTFKDATREAGIEALLRGKGYGMGIAVGDYDNDGRPDVFLSRLDRYVLLHNRGDGTFEDATARLGLDGPRENPTSAVFADLDNDGDLDLYVCHYARWDPNNPPRCTNQRGFPQYCDPAKYEAAPDHVFRNEGDRFRDVTSESGFTDSDGRGLGVASADLDGDGQIDLFVANDGTANFLFRNLGNFRFEEVATMAGAAGNAEGGFRAGMGVLVRDLDGDGRLDVLVNNLYGEGSTLYQNLGEGLFADRSAVSGVLRQTRFLTGFGVAALDPANEGVCHVAIANGHINDDRPYYPHAMPCRLYRVTEGPRFLDVSAAAGEVWATPRLGRGLVAGDLDHDGRTDLLVVSQNEPLVYLHNRTEKVGRGVTLLLEGVTSNRDGIGATLTVRAGSKTRILHRVGGGSYLSAGDPRLHCGLGDVSVVDQVEVRWPSGRIDCWRNLQADKAYRLREGAKELAALPGFRS